jgi:hypothetical protein
MPGTTLPQRVPAAMLALEPTPTGRPLHVPRHSYEQRLIDQPTAPYAAVNYSPASDGDTTAEFNRITAAGWDTGEQTRLLELVDTHRCDSCRARRHGDCPGCECPCTTDAYVEVRGG